MQKALTYKMGYLALRRAAVLGAHMRLMLLACSLALSMPVLAHGYPSGPVRLIVPYTPGGGTDALARVVAKGLSEKWKQSVIVENRPGADATIGIDIASRAEPDGQTLAMVVTTHAVQESLKSHLPYRLLRDFDPITELAEVPSVLVTAPDLHVDSVGALVAMAKKEPGRLNFASTGYGGPAHLAGELFNQLAGIKTVAVPYKGGGQALIDLMGGHVNFMFTTVPAGLSAIKAGNIKALAVTGSKRSDSIPEIPTMAEAGVAGYKFMTWYGLVTKKGVPPAIVDKISSDIRAVVRTKDVSRILAAEGARVVASTPKEFSRFLGTEVRQWAKVVKSAHMKVE